MDRTSITTTSWHFSSSSRRAASTANARASAPGRSNGGARGREPGTTVTGDGLERRFAGSLMCHKGTPEFEEGQRLFDGPEGRRDAETLGRGEEAFNPGALARDPAKGRGRLVGRVVRVFGPDDDQS